VKLYVFFEPLVLIKRDNSVRTLHCFNLTCVKSQLTSLASPT
jgi:hypothetical protein